MTSEFDLHYIDISTEDKKLAENFMASPSHPVKNYPHLNKTFAFGFFTGVGISLFYTYSRDHIKKLLSF